MPNVLVLATCETHWSKIEPQGSTLSCSVRNGVGQGLSVFDDTIFALLTPYDEFKDLDDT